MANNYLTGKNSSCVDPERNTLCAMNHSFMIITFGTPAYLMMPQNAYKCETFNFSIMYNGISQCFLVKTNIVGVCDIGIVQKFNTIIMRILPIVGLQMKSQDDSDTCRF
ncbi:hypothetical protein KUTeg_019243 [Tegillarca granosa]|uniref:Uncharacterized protein n=1 Tax=Tegillarca granosa TaxID=220873 RepID=A0ABQ9EGY8_TEGGR|nr:hypothetical protein KUTeg_019243 [Tegillarca granosa]